jgi:hypothetical protein
MRLMERCGREIHPKDFSGTADSVGPDRRPLRLLHTLLSSIQDVLSRTLQLTNLQQTNACIVYKVHRDFLV